MLPNCGLKALSYLEDGNVAHVPMVARRRLIEAVRGVDLDRLPVIRPHDQVAGSAPGGGP